MAKRHRIQKDDRNGNYFVRIQVDGERKYFNLGPRLKDARRSLARLEKGIRTGKLAFSSARHDSTTVPVAAAASDTPAARSQDKAGGLRLGELIDLHLKWVKDNRAGSTLWLYDTYEHAFLDFLGDIPVSSVTRLMLEDFFAWARNNRGRGQNAGFEAALPLLNCSFDIHGADHPIFRSAHRKINETGAPHDAEQLVPRSQLGAAVVAEMLGPGGIAVEGTSVHSLDLWEKSGQSPRRGGLGGSALTADQNASDLRVDGVEDQRALEFLLAHDRREGESGWHGITPALLSGGWRVTSVTLRSGQVDPASAVL